MGEVSSSLEEYDLGLIPSPARHISLVLKKNSADIRLFPNGVPPPDFIMRTVWEKTHVISTLMRAIPFVGPCMYLARQKTLDVTKFGL